MCISNLFIAKTYIKLEKIKEKRGYCPLDHNLLVVSFLIFPFLGARTLTVKQTYSLYLKIYSHIFTPFSLTTPNRVIWNRIKFTTFFQVCMFTSVGLKCNVTLNAMLLIKGLCKPEAKYVA